MLAMGDIAISPSSTSKRKNCWRLRYRVAAVEGVHRLSWSAMNASTCARPMDSIVVGRPRSMRKASSSQHPT